jgi:hypothetical protein
VSFHTGRSWGALVGAMNKAAGAEAGSTEVYIVRVEDSVCLFSAQHLCVLVTLDLAGGAQAFDLVRKVRDNDAILAPLAILEVHEITTQHRSGLLVGATGVITGTVTALVLMLWLLISCYRGCKARAARRKVAGKPVVGSAVASMEPDAEDEDEDAALMAVGPQSAKM